MSTPPYEPQVVTVSANTISAFDCPTLIVHQNGVYYVSLAVWTIDPKYPDPDPEQCDGIAIVEKLFREATLAAKGDAVVIDHKVAMFSGMATPRPDSG